MQRPPSQISLQALLLLLCFFPISYFAIQLIAAPFFPGYDFATHAASDLGSPQSQRPIIFNGGAILGGALGVLGAAGLLFVLLRTRMNPFLAVPLCLIVAAAAASSLWAGLYPLPDPRHGANPLAIGLFAMPAAALLLWGRAGSGMRIYLALNALFMLTFAVLVMTKVISPDGWNQRLFAVLVFGPIFAAGWIGLASLKRTA